MPNKCHDKPLQHHSPIALFFFWKILRMFPNRIGPFNNSYKNSYQVTRFFERLVAAFRFPETRLVSKTLQVSGRCSNKNDICDVMRGRKGTEPGARQLLSQQQGDHG